MSCGLPIKPQTKAKILAYEKTQQAENKIVKRIKVGCGAVVGVLMLMVFFGWLLSQSPKIAKPVSIESNPAYDETLEEVITSNAIVRDRIKGIKLSISYDIEKRYTEEELKNYCILQLQDFGNYDRIFFEFWLEGMLKDAGSYASLQYENGRFIVHQMSNFDNNLTASNYSEQK